MRDRLECFPLKWNREFVSTAYQFVMAGLVPAIHVLAAVKTWMPGTYAKPRFAL
jgi:hypothetical protein